jgi:hypothetical protein
MGSKELLYMVKNPVSIEPIEQSVWEQMNTEEFTKYLIGIGATPMSIEQFSYYSESLGVCSRGIRGMHYRQGYLPLYDSYSDRVIIVLPEDFDDFKSKYNANHIAFVLEHEFNHKQQFDEGDLPRTMEFVQKINRIGNPIEVSNTALDMVRLVIEFSNGENVSDYKSMILFLINNTQQIESKYVGLKTSYYSATMLSEMARDYAEAYWKNLYEKNPIVS